MKYLEMFNEIVDIMENDYSGCDIKRGWSNPEYYRQLVRQALKSNKLDRSNFKEIVDEYILDFKDSHVKFIDVKSKSNPTSIGFEVRRYEDTLYIINVDQENNFKVGMPIVELDNVLVKDVAQKYEKQLMGQPNERQLWEKIIAKSETITMLDDGEMRKIDINTYSEKNTESKYEYKRIDYNTIFLCYNDFMDYDLSQKLLS